MGSPFIGQVVLFAGNFAPRGWALCQGQILSIAQNTALFSILGVTYGGNGQTTFALPDLRGRVPVGQGQGPGLSSYALGQQAGTETVTLTVNQMPMHNHPFTPLANSDTGTQTRPNGGYLATLDNLYSPTNDNTAMGQQQTGISGGSQPHDNIQPYTTLNYIICMEGIYPSRN